MYGVLQSGRGILTGSVDILLCYYEKDTLKLSNQYFTGCYYNNVGIAETEKNEINITLYPNPIVGTSAIVIEGNTDKENFVLDIYSIIGTKVRTIIINNENQAFIKKTDFSSGLYFYKFTSSKSEIKSGKFVIE